MSSYIVKNTVYLVTALLIQKSIAFVYFTLLVRGLAVEEIGAYSTVISFSLIFSIFADVGMTAVLIRDIAAARAKSGNQRHVERTLIGSALGLKLILSICAYGILYVGVRVAGYPETVARFTWIAGIIMILDSMQITFYGILRAYSALRFEAYGMIFGQIFAFVLGAVFLWQQAPLLFFFFALAFASAYNVIWSAYVLRRRFRAPLTIYFVRAELYALLKSALPFALAGFFVKLYSFVDSLLLARIAGMRAAGLYSVPYKLAFAFQFIPLAFIAALYPAMSTAYAADRAKLKQLFEQSMVYMGIIAAFITTALFSVSELLIRLLYGAQYIGGVSALRVLAFTIFFTFLGYPVGSLFNASHKQNIQTLLIGLTAALNIAMNLVLIPFIGITGAALAALISNIFLTVVGCIWSIRLIGMPTTFFFRSFIKICASSALALAGAGLLRAPFSVFLRAPLLGQAAYVTCLAAAAIGIYCAGLIVSGVLNRFVVRELVSVFKKTQANVQETCVDSSVKIYAEE